MFEPVIITVIAGSMLSLIDVHSVTSTIVTAASGCASAVQNPVVLTCLSATVKAAVGIIYLAAAAVIVYSCLFERKISIEHGAEIVHYFNAAIEQFHIVKQALASLFKSAKTTEEDDKEEPKM